MKTPSRNWGQRVCLALIRAYRLLLSPWIGGACRFELSCSHYAERVIKNYGCSKGLALTTWRLLRCHPWSNSTK